MTAPPVTEDPKRVEPTEGNPEPGQPPAIGPAPENLWSRFKGWVHRQFTGMTMVALVLALLGLAGTLGWKPFEHRQPEGPIAVIERPARRALSTEGMRNGLLALLPRRGAKVQVEAIVEQEAINFEFEIQRFLLAEGFDVLRSMNPMVGGRPAWGQNVYERDGVYIIELGSNDGSREWKHGAPIFWFRKPIDLNNAPSIRREDLDDPPRP